MLPHDKKKRGLVKFIHASVISSFRHRRINSFVLLSFLPPLSFLGFSPSLLLYFNQSNPRRGIGEKNLKERDRSEDLGYVGR